MGAKWFGAAVKRKEDPALLAGEGRFIDDVRLPGTLHAAFVRSAYPHAKIRGVDTAAARRLAGVHLVLAFADLPEPMRKNALPLFVPSPAITAALHALCARRARETVYAGEPIAIVVADSRHIAEDAAALVEVDYEPLPGVSDCAAAIEPGSPLAHADAKSNIAARRADHGRRCRCRLRRRRACGRASASTSTAAGRSSWNAAGWWRATMRSPTPTRSTSPRRARTASSADCSTCSTSTTTRCTSSRPMSAAASGPRARSIRNIPASPPAPRLLGRPVKWIEDRRENFLCTHQERDQFWDLELAVDRDAKILGLRGRLVHDTGAYRAVGPGAAVDRRHHGARALRDPELPDRAQRRLHQHDLDDAGARRRPPAGRVRDGADDGPARRRRLGLDRAEVRRRNFITPEQMPYKVGIIFRDGRPGHL